MLAQFLVQQRKLGLNQRQLSLRSAVASNHLLRQHRQPRQFLLHIGMMRRNDMRAQPLQRCLRPILCCRRRPMRRRLQRGNPRVHFNVVRRARLGQRLFSAAAIINPEVLKHPNRCRLFQCNLANGPYSGCHFSSPCTQPRHPRHPSQRLWSLRAKKYARRPAATHPLTLLNSPPCPLNASIWPQPSKRPRCSPASPLQNCTNSRRAPCASASAPANSSSPKASPATACTSSPPARSASSKPRSAAANRCSPSTLPANP